MQLNIQKSHVTGSEAIQSFGFTIKADPKAFHLLIAQLYKDRIAAFIRELSTNAYEAHQMSGIEDQPFEVTLPSFLNPSFKIRDFGPGLSLEQVAQVYTTIFESTKTNDNNMGGCFGLGSKSPFAYSENFGVISYHNGMKYCFTVFKDEEGYPKMNLLQQEPSNERTGIEISIPINRGDHGTVERKAREIYQWFATTPKIMNSPLPFTKIKPNVVGSNFGHYDRSDVQYASARMGNIVYQIDNNLCNLHGLHTYPIVVEFPIGALTPEPSREGLSYDKRTKRAIEEAFATIKKEYISKVQPEVDKCESYYDAVLVAQRLIQNSPVTLTELTFNGEILHSRLGDLDDKVGMAKVVSSDKLKKGYGDNLDISENYTFFVLDKKCAYQQIIKQYLRANSLGTYNRKIFICDEAYQGHTRDEFKKFFKINDKRLVVISSVPYTPPPRQKGVGRSNRHLTKVFTWTYSHNNASSWNDTTIDANATSGYYVVYFNNKILANGKEIAPAKLKILMDLIGFSGQIHGVKKDSVDKLSKLPNWVNFLDYAKPLAYNVMRAASSEDAQAAGRIVQSFRYTNSTTHEFIEKMALHGVTSANPDVLAACVEHEKVMKLARMNYNSLSEIATGFYGETLSQIGSTKTLDRDRYGRLLETIENKYPLVSEINNMTESVVKELVNYIALKGI